MARPDSIRQSDSTPDPEGEASRLDLETAVRTAAGLVVVPLATGLFGGLAIAPGLLGNRALPELCTRGWAHTVAAMAGVKLKSDIDPGLDQDKRYIFVSNHQSHLDIVSIVLSWPGPVRFVAKKQLFRIPIFGQALTAVGHIKVDRGNREQAQASLARALEPLKTRVSILFFAEGTRSETGELGRFKKGALSMAEASHAQVVPVGVVGTREILRKGSLQLHGGPVGVSIGLPVEGMDDTTVPREERLRRLRDAVAAQMDRARALREGA